MHAVIPTKKWHKCSHFCAGHHVKSGLNPELSSYFNIFINNFFYLVKGTEIYNYADDTTIFACGSDMCSILKSHEEDASLLSLWFENNYMKMNEDKSHLLVLGSKGGGRICKYFWIFDTGKR